MGNHAGTGGFQPKPGEPLPQMLWQAGSQDHPVHHRQAEDVQGKNAMERPGQHFENIFRGGQSHTSSSVARSRGIQLIPKGTNEGGRCAVSFTQGFGYAPEPTPEAEWNAP